MTVSIAHAGLDIIKSKDPIYKSQIKQLESLHLPSKNNGSKDAAPITPDDPLMVLKQLFKPKEHASKILDKNHIANKYRQKYLEEMKKE